jgi:hypothetical protein
MERTEDPIVASSEKILQIDMVRYLHQPVYAHPYVTPVG